MGCIRPISMWPDEEAARKGGDDKSAVRNVTASLVSACPVSGNTFQGGGPRRPAAERG
jgi:hypothetical protein